MLSVMSVVDFGVAVAVVIVSIWMCLECRKKKRSIARSEFVLFNNIMQC